MLLLTPSFTSRIHDIYGKMGKAWLEDLPNRLSQLSVLWNFRFLKPMPDLSYNFISLVQMEAPAKMAVLKMAPEGGDNLPNEVRWLSSIGEGAPELYGFDEKLNAYLMEYLSPGDSLKKLVRTGHNDKATRVICQMIRTLQSRTHVDVNFRHLSELSTGFRLLEGKFDAKLLSQAQGCFHDLTFDRTGDTLLHGDLHHGNVLACGSGWKVIDPHGYVGDPVAEVGAMVRNAFERFPNNPSLSKVVERRLQVMADELPFDPLKIKHWALCMTVLSAAWNVEDHGGVPELTQQTAIAIDQSTV